MGTEHPRRQISDLSLAAFLSSTGHILIGTENDGPRAVFIFEDSEGLQRDILAFYNRQTKVDALTFAENIRNLKGLTRMR